MEALAAFVESPAGAMAYNVARHFGTDPAAGIADDVVAYNLRAALLLTHGLPSEEPEPGFGEKYSGE